MSQNHPGKASSTKADRSQDADSLWEQIERERAALASDRERLEADRRAWQTSVAETGANGSADVDTRFAQQQARLDAQRREFEQTRASIATREAELDAVQLDLDRRETALEQQRREIARANEDLAAAREEVHRLSESLETSQASRQVDQLAEFYLQQQAEIDAEREQLQSLRDEIRAEQAEHERASQTLDDEKASLERQIAAMEERRQQLEDQRKDLSQQRDQLSAERAELAEDHASLEAGQAELDRRREELEHESREVRGMRDRLLSQQEQAEEQRASLEAEQTALASRAEGIEKQRAALAAQREKLVARQQELDDEREQLQQTREKLQQETETHRAELRAKVDQFEKQLTQVTERGRQLSTRQQSLDERERAIEETERRTNEELARRRGEIDAAQKDLDERIRNVETEEKRLEVSRIECDQRAAELQEHMTAFSADREHILGLQSQFETRAEELDARDQHLDRVEAELNQQREQLDVRRGTTQTKETALAEREKQLDGREEKLAQLEVEHAERQSALQREIDEADNSNRENQRELERQLDELAEREKALTSQTSELELRERQLEADRDRLEDAKSELDQQQLRLGETQDQLSGRQRKIDEEAAELDRRQAELEQRLSQAPAPATESNELGQLEQRLTEESERIEADRKQLDQDRQAAARELAEERRVFEQQRQEVSRLSADLDKRERRLAAEVDAVQKVAAKTKPAKAPEQIVIETMGFNLRRALVVAGALAVVSAVLVVAVLGFRREVRGDLRIVTEADINEVLLQVEAKLRSPDVIDDAKRLVDADVTEQDIDDMIRSGRDIQVRTVSEKDGAGQLQLIATTDDYRRAEAVINALGQALEANINGQGSSSQPSDEFGRLQAQLTEARSYRTKDQSSLDAARKQAETVAKPDPSVEQLESRYETLGAKLDEAKQAAAKAEADLATFTSSRLDTAVDTGLLKDTITKDTQHKQDRDQFHLRAQQLRTILLDGLDAARSPLAVLSERVDAFAKETDQRIKDKPADDVVAALTQIKKALDACRQTLGTSQKAWNDLLAKVRQRDKDKADQSALPDQQQAEQLLSELVDQLREPIMEIHKQVQAIAQTGGDDMTRRIVIQDALRKQAEELTSALRTFANAGADVIPMSNQRLDACVREIRRLQERLSEREKEISAGMEKRAADRAAEAQATQLAKLQAEVARQAAQREKTFAEMRDLVRNLVAAQKQQAIFDEAQAKMSAAADRLERSQAHVATVEAQIASYREKAGSLPATARKDTAKFSGAIVYNGLANQEDLVKWAGGVAAFAFAMTLLVTWLVSGGRPITRRVPQPVAGPKARRSPKSAPPP
ncbi:MAG: hypothetical protein JXQ73_31670 [Phycisphaerae bacterium]|nr:hypothetical protein [Phycisphaerae bacterium]